MDRTFAVTARQNGYGYEDLASMDGALNINNKADLPDCTLVPMDTATTGPKTRTARCSGTATAVHGRDGFGDQVRITRDGTKAMTMLGHDTNGARVYDAPHRCR